MPDLFINADSLAVSGITTETTVAELFQKDLISVRSKNRLTEARFNTLGDVLRAIQTPRDLMNFRGVGDKVYSEVGPLLEYVIARMWSGAGRNESEFGEDGQQSGDISVAPAGKETLLLTGKALPDTAMQYLQKIYLRMAKDQLSTRGFNFVDRYLRRFVDMLKVSNRTLSQFSADAPHYFGRKTMAEVYKFSKSFVEEYERVLALPDDAVVLENLGFDYPFLSEEERQIVLEYQKAHHHLPIFLLMYTYLCKSTNKSDIIHRLLHGIGGTRSDMLEVSRKMGISRERVRQIESGTINVQLQPFMEPEQQAFYTELHTKVFFHTKSPEYLQIKETEHLPVDFNQFAGLLMLLRGFSIVKAGKQYMVINAALTEGFDFKAFYRNLSDTIQAKHYASARIPATELMKDVPLRLHNELKPLISYLAKTNFGVRTDDNFGLLIKQNKVDVGAELYDILKANGRPMSLLTLFNLLKERYPNYKLSNPDSLRSYLYGHRHIKPVGKKSVYGLDSWSGIYYGNIRTLLIETLRKSEEPLSLDSLTAEVNRFFPGTDRNNIATSMQIDTKHRFVRFQNDIYGLRNRKYADTYTEETFTRRYDFHSRLEELRSFVAKHKRFPLYNSDEKEASLLRWYRNSLSTYSHATPEQRQEIKQIIEQCRQKGYPISTEEYNFLENCHKFMAFVDANQVLPSASYNSSLYEWFYRSKCHSDFTDQRRNYWAELTNGLKKRKFNI